MYLYLYLKSKSVSIPLALTAAVSQADVETQIDSLIWILSSLSLGFGNDNIENLKWTNWRYHENS